MTISEPGIAMLKYLERFRGKLYNDCGRWRIGYGFILTQKQAIEYLERDATEAEADGQLRDRLIPLTYEVQAQIKRPIEQHQFDALCMLAWNIGIKTWLWSNMIRRLNTGDLADVALAFDRAHLMNDEESMARRQKEKALFVVGKYA